MDTPKSNTPSGPTLTALFSSSPKKPLGQEGTFTVTLDAQKHRIWTAALSDSVTVPDNYHALVDIIYNAEATDIIKLNIYSYGGWVETGIMLIQALRNTKARVITTIYGMCASIAALIWLAGKERRATPNATLMIHMPSGAQSGKTADIEEQTHGIQEYFTWVLTQLTQGIVTTEELANVIHKRRDLYIDAATLQQRLGGK